MISEHKIDFGQSKSWSIEIEPGQKKETASIKIFMGPTGSNNVELEFDIQKEILKRLVVLGTRFLKKEEKSRFVTLSDGEVFYIEDKDGDNSKTYPVQKILNQHPL